jgi:hypothetical protein
MLVVAMLIILKSEEGFVQLRSASQRSKNVLLECREGGKGVPENFP